MAIESVTSTSDENERLLDLYNRVMDDGTAQALFKAMAVLQMGIESTRTASLGRAFLSWPSTAEVVWDILDGIMIRAGVSDGKDCPWIDEVFSDETEAQS